MGKIWSWSFALLVALLALQVFPSNAENAGNSHLAPADSDKQEYFWNEITGETQWEDPGDVPYEDEDANRYWLTPNGDRLGYDPNAHRYTWVENWSEEHQRPFYYNQKTKESKWEKPVDLAWRRVKVKDSEEL